MTAKQSHSGVYWCESRLGDSSDAVNISVTGGLVVLQSPILPVVQGDNVTLRCRTKETSNLEASFYKNNTLIRTGPTGHTTIFNASRSDEGVYKCCIAGFGESPTSWLLMEDGSNPPSLTPSPDSSQHLEYEDLSLNCGNDTSSHGWRVRRFTASDGTMSSCGDKWGTPTPSGCHLTIVKQPDSALYWCETPAKRRSNSVNISVHDGAVILQIPVLAVMGGDNVTLTCRTKTSSDLPADFYKGDELRGTEPGGHMTIYNASRSHEGVYRCRIRGQGESPPGRLLVRVFPDPDDAERLSVTTVLRYIVLFAPYFISTTLMLSEYRHRAVARSVSMAVSPSSREDDGLDPQYDDIIAAVTTEHHF
ncbi:sialoadhesin-like [Brachyistius frenatus]|uniref:sialoadhesin-like n=1 Tax=Brachyistius frenatus TaxID=100188 RepID=UPI0037E856F8